MADQTIGVLLRSYIHESRSQKQLAMEWASAYGKAAGSNDAVESRLCELLGGIKKGVSYFFRDPKRAELLFKLLKVPQEEREPIVRAAQAIMDGTNIAQVIVDVRDLGDDLSVVGLTAALLDLLTRLGGAGRVLLVTTRGGEKTLTADMARLCEPRSNCDDEDVKQLLTESGWLFSRRRLAPYTRWAAMEYRAASKVLDLDPPDAPDLVRQRADFPGPVEPKYPLDELSSERAPRTDHLPVDPLALRQLAVALAAPKLPAYIASHYSPFISAASRLTAADRLSVRAGATEWEWENHKLVRLVEGVGLEPRSGDERQLQGQLHLAPLIPISTALWVSGTLHVLNPRGELPDHSRLKVHRLGPEVSALSRLLTATTDWTPGDLALDPVLLRLTANIKIPEAELPMLDHARRWLLSHPNWRLVDADSVVDVPDCVAKLLGGPAPACRRLMVAGGSQEDRWATPYRASYTGPKDSPPSELDWATDYLNDKNDTSRANSLNRTRTPAREWLGEQAIGELNALVAAELWHFLRRCVTQGIASSDGRWFSFIDGIAVEFSARAAPTAKQAVLALKFSESSRGGPQLETMMIATTGGSLQVPAQVLLATEGAIMRVNFHSTTLFRTVSVTSPRATESVRHHDSAYD